MKTIYAAYTPTSPITKELFPNCGGWAFYTNLKKAVQAAGLDDATYQAVRRRMKTNDDCEYAGQRFVRLELK